MDDRHRVLDGGRMIAELVGARPSPSPPRDAALVISRFAWLRRDGELLVAESARAAGRVTLAVPAGALLLQFSVPTTIARAVEPGVGLSEAVATELAGLLLGCGVLLGSDVASEDELPLAVWEFHDLLFHTRSRAGRHSNPIGGSYRFAGRIDPAPALPPPRWPRALQLQRPDFEQLRRHDPSLSAVQAARCSIREYDESPIDADQLGEFLYRVARADDLWLTASLDPAHPIEVVARPYPAGGSLYELETYLGIGRCRGLEPGLYHYETGEHVLERVAEDSERTRALIEREALGAGVAPQQVQVLVLVTARMHRIAWKYASLAYSLVLKHVGVLIDTMYLAATAMELAPCAIGGGDSDLFSEVTGLDYYEEPLVGEFVVGRRRG